MPAETNSFFSPQTNKSPTELAKTLLKRLGSKKLIETLKKMLLIRNFEVRAESAYLHGKIGGFFHAYTGQEAIQTAALDVFGLNNWWITTYRCHALALLTGATPHEIMAELYGKATGNAKGRGGSMHLYTDRMLGGFGIVGGHLAIALGAAFSVKYLDKKNEIAICFLGDGAVAQGSFHESLNLGSLWNLPCIYVIENNQWGMGTHVSRAIAIEHIAEKMAKSYGIEGFTLNGMDYFNCYAGFEYAYQKILKKERPILIECICERFKGHSVSDPGLYRTKAELQKSMEKDPILHLRHFLEEQGIIDEEQFKALDKHEKEIVMDAMRYAEESPFPSPATLEEDVYAP